MSKLNENEYNSIVNFLEAQLVIKYRDSVRNHNEDNPIFRIGDIGNPTTKDEGFGITGIAGQLLLDTLSQYASTTNRISINLQDQTIQLTEQGKQRMHELDPQID